MVIVRQRILPLLVQRTANAMLRKGILGLARSQRASGFVHRYGARLGARRFVAGETLDQALDVLADLNRRGLHANTTLLGEDVQTPAEAEAVVREYEEILDRIAARELKVNVALKLTHLGLLIDEELAAANLQQVVDRAASHGNFIRIDMEGSPLVDATLRIYRGLRESGRDSVGAVLQAYLFRTEQDLDDLLPLQPNLRLVKGAYLEPPSVAYPAKSDVDAAYLRLVERAMRGGAYVAVATHDDGAIEHVIRFTEQHGIPRDRFEFQMLFGVRPQLQQDLAGRGFKVLVATPFGPEWYPYLMRRMAERPANLLFVLRNLARR
jgi:proline dehydrogenase